MNEIPNLKKHKITLSYVVYKCLQHTAASMRTSWPMATIFQGWHCQQCHGLGWNLAQWVITPSWSWSWWSFESTSCQLIKTWFGVGLSTGETGFLPHGPFIAKRNYIYSYPMWSHDSWHKIKAYRLTAGRSLFWRESVHDWVSYIVISWSNHLCPRSFRFPVVCQQCRCPGMWSRSLTYVTLWKSEMYIFRFDG